ncbi:MAG: hypothetical protein GY725_01190 [bacterium]|nr:hypothetical protein [bacterium]
MKRALKFVAALLTISVVIAGIAYLFRTDPIGPISGRKLSGDEVSWPDNWDFTREIMFAAIEVRPDDPHSVTTIVFVYEGALFIPAKNGSSKRWTQYVSADPRVRVKLGDQIVPGRAMRIEDDSQREAMTDAARTKYASLLPAGEDPPQAEDVWVFRIDPR